MAVDFYINVDGKIVHITEGTGDNLLQEDIEEGYVDYIYYEVFDLAYDFPESDGGMVLTTEYVADMDKREITLRVLDMMGYVLPKDEEWVELDK